MIKTDALIIGAGPTGLFTAHQLKLIGLDCEIVDNLDKIGGQCIELYPDKPIYDIPAIPECTGEELTNNLLEQLKPFNIKFHLGERVDELKKDNEKWKVKTSKGTEFETPNVIIAGGVGSFEPRKFSPKECEQFENKTILYSIKDKKIFDVFDNSNAQSNALSPPPKIDTVLPSNIFLSLIEYKIVLFSNCSHSFGENFLGSKDPTPPAIITFGVSNSVPLLVFTFHFSLSFFNSSTLSPK